MHLKKIMPDFKAHILAQKAKEDKQRHAEQQEPEEKPIDIPDEEYLEHIAYLDMVLAKRKLSDFDKKVVDSLLESHPAYKKYFFRKVGDNDLV